MKMILLGVSSLCCVVACGSKVVVGESGTGGCSAVGAPYFLDPCGASGSGGGSAGTSSVPTGDAGDDGLGPVYTWTDPTTAPDCTVSPLSAVSYSTTAQLDALLLGKWRRCVDPQFPGEDVGVEFTADGNYYPLTFDASHHVVRRLGVDYQGTWAYYPPGSVDALGQEAGADGSFAFGSALYPDQAVTTSPPLFLSDPQQMRVTYSPVLSKYVPLTP